MKTVKLTALQAYAIAEARRQIASTVLPIKFGYALARTGRSVQAVIDALTEAQEKPAPEYLEYVRQAQAEPEKQGELAEQFAAAIAAEDARRDRWRAMLSEEQDVEVHFVDLDQVPDLPAGVVDALLPMIRQCDEKENAA